MRSSRVVRASDCQCRRRNSPGFDPSFLPHSGILGAADESVLNTVHRKKGLGYSCQNFKCSEFAKLNSREKINKNLVGNSFFFFFFYSHFALDFLPIKIGDYIMHNYTYSTGSSFIIPSFINEIVEEWFLDF
jgi:hypothetical protein